MKDNIYCVYFHKNPTTNIIFYVGIGNIKRPYSKRGRSEYWKNYVKKHGMIIDIIHSNLSWLECCDLEKKYIAQYKRSKDGGTLVNLTMGGEGTLGYIPPTIKSIYFYNLDGYYVMEFDSISNAAAKLNMGKSTISSSIDTNAVCNKQYLIRSVKCDRIIIDTITILSKMKHQGKPVYQYDINGNLINTFNSVVRAYIELGITESLVRKKLRTGELIDNYYLTYIQTKPIY